MEFINYVKFIHVIKKKCQTLACLRNVILNNISKSNLNNEKIIPFINS